MVKKRVIVICGTGVATSTLVLHKVREFLREKGIDAHVQQGKISDLLTSGGDFDLIISTTAVPPSVNQEKVVNAVPILTGAGKERVFEEIEAKLTNEGE
ncbi:MAG: PTS sugar transporter subunit IIB [Planifilum sp.]|jgi:PTS system galactitol-specific IIB component